MWHYSQYLNTYPLWNPNKDADSTDTLLATWYR